ncbi:acylphosphatase [Vreelandella sp. EE22]
MARRQKQVNGTLLEQEARPNSVEAERLAANVRQLISLERYELAVEVLLQLQRLDPGHAEGFLLQGELELESGELAKAFHSLLAASYQLTDYPKVFWLLAKLHAQSRHDRAAISAMLRYVELNPKYSVAMLLLSALYQESGFNGHAKYWIKQAIRNQPFSCDRKVSDACRKMRVLVLKTVESVEWRVNRKTFLPYASEGHNNLSQLLDKEHVEVWTLYIDQLNDAPELVRKLPEIDLIYNAITDAERCEEALKAAQKLCNRLGKPVVNTPDKVVQASRQGNYARFKENSTILLPKSVKIESTQQSAKSIAEKVVMEHQITSPFIIRLAGYQGGKFMHKVDDLETHDFSALDAELERQIQTVYIIQYHKVSYLDERASQIPLYPKYRAFLVGDRLFPCHLFTADGFNVHKKNADPVMSAHPWLMDLEREYCEDPVKHIGSRQWTALEDAMRELGLDYCGVDFALSTQPDEQGKVVVFEMNPAMRNWVNQLPEGDTVQQAWKRVTAKFHEHMCNVAGKEPWDFTLPQGTVPSQEPERDLTLRLYIKGNVQGVGYRQWFVEQLAERGIAGWVRNLPNGSVEAVIHGQLAALQLLCDEVPKGPEGSRVTGLDVVNWEGAVPKGTEILETPFETAG